MAIQFNENNTGTVYTAATAIDAFRLGLMVNPTTGANVSRTLANQRTDVENIFGFTTEAEQDSPVLLVSVARAVPVGSAAITDRTIIIDGPAARLSALSQGAHVSFYNCRIIIRQWDNASAVLTPPIGTFSSAGTGGAGVGGRETPTNFLTPATGRSVNCYGCTIHIAEETARHANIFGNFGDFIGSDVTFGGPTTRPGGMAVNFTYQTGGRFINSTHTCNPVYTQLQSLQGYSFSDVFEGATLYGCGMTSGNATTATSAGSGPRLLTEARFAYDNQTNYFLIQGDARTGWNEAANSFLQVGFRTPSDNGDRGGVVGNGSFGDNATDYLGIVNGAGSVYNFAGYLPTYRDLISGDPVQNVRVRVATSALRGAATPTTTANWHSQLTADDTEKTLGTNFYANEYLTDATGQLVTSRSSLNGWSSASNGSYDPFRFDVRTATGSAQLASLDLDTIVLNAPEHCAPVLLQHLKGTATGSGAANAGFTRHQARYQARSYTHNVSEDFTESSTTLPDGTARAINENYAIDRTVRNDLARVGLINQNEALAESKFDTAAARNGQDIYEYILARWSTYDTDIEPMLVGDVMTWNGDLTLRNFNSAPTFNTAGDFLTLNRVSSIAAGTGVGTISAQNMTLATNIDGVNITSTGVMDLTSSVITNSTLTALSFSSFPTTLDGSITFVGEVRYTSNGILTVTDNSNLGGLTLNVQSGVTLTINGATAADFAAITGTGTVLFPLNFPIENDRTAGLRTIYRNGTEFVTTGDMVPNIQPNEVIVVVYTEAGRTDFFQRIVTGASPQPTTITITNSATPFSDADPIAGNLQPQTPVQRTHLGETRWVMDILTTRNIVSQAQVSADLQAQVKGTSQYNRLIQRTETTELVGSDGATSVANADENHVQFISVVPITVAYIRPLNNSNDPQVFAGPLTAGQFTPTGGSASPLNVGVTMASISNFDPAITAGQVEGIAEMVIADATVNTTALTTAISTNTTAVNDHTTTATEAVTTAVSTQAGTNTTLITTAIGTQTTTLNETIEREGLDTASAVNTLATTNTNTITSAVANVSATLGAPAESGMTVSQVLDEAAADTDNLRKQKLLGIKPQVIKS